MVTCNLQIVSFSYLILIALPYLLCAQEKDFDEAMISCLNNKKSIIPQNGSKSNDKIAKLPGQPMDFEFDQYGGYVELDSERALFYYFSESHMDASLKPLVLWLEGGPGCSGIGYGLFEIMGPFGVDKDGQTLYKNDHTWNTEANLLFLESPIGAGFSYSNRTSDYDNNGDISTARDSYIFLLNWFERFPEYKSRDFYITGESYGGHYVPQLAQMIMHNNKCGNHTRINLRGIAIGNGIIDLETLERGKVDFYWSHALISDDIHRGLLQNCQFLSATNMSETCTYFVNLTNSVMRNLSMYQIYAPLCNSAQSVPDSMHDPCAGNYVNYYLNTPEVQEALHANVTKLPYPWVVCNSTIQALWKDSVTSTLPVIKELMGSGLRVWLYSGDADAVVPVTSTRYAINKMKLSVKTPWYAWYAGGEVGGYAVGYEDLTFMTVRGGGHAAPAYEPARAFVMFKSFLKGQLPYAN